MLLNDIALSYYAKLVSQARRESSSIQNDEGTIALESIRSDSFDIPFHKVLAGLDQVNRAISIEQSKIDQAEQDYTLVGKHLIKALKWNNDDISVISQGSCRTRTLISSMNREMFDIDAVCEVFVNRHEVWEPLAFFEQFHAPLSDKWKVQRKNRCWQVQDLHQHYYLEFTPSVPLSQIPSRMLPKLDYRPTGPYQSTALAVVDRRTERWKTSNPVGFASWVDHQSKRVIVSPMTLRFAVEARGDVEALPKQEVLLHDVLRVAIRLFKRHRDVMVSRGEIKSEFKPISVLLVTLITQCYAGLADLKTIYANPLALLADLARLLPHMIDRRNGKWMVENPTIAMENFAERWNESPEYVKAFKDWSSQLYIDIKHVLAAQEPEGLKSALKHAFGPTPQSGAAALPAGIAVSAPSRPARPAGTGLA